MPDAIVLNGHRTPTTVQRRENGGLVLRQGGRFVILDASELGEVLAFARSDEAPQLGRIVRFPAPDPDTVECNFIE